MSNLNSILESLSTEEKRYFRKLHRQGDRTSMSAFLLERGYDATQTEAIATEAFPRSKRALQVQAVGKNYRGLDPEEVLEAVAGQSFLLSQEILKIAKNNKLDTKTLQRYLELTAGLLKESRSAAASLHNLELQQTRKEIGLSVAARFVEVLERIFAQEDSQFRNALSLGLKAALLEIEKEL